MWIRQHAPPGKEQWIEMMKSREHKSNLLVGWVVVVGVNSESGAF